MTDAPNSFNAIRAEFMRRARGQHCARGLRAVVVGDQPSHAEAFAALDAWQFSQKTILTWAKNHRQGTGDWLIGQTEHCLLAVRGKPVVTLSNQTTLLQAARRAHSQKPVEFYELVESLCPAPRYADLFSRYRHNERWDCHGDEAPPAAAAGPPAAAPALDQGRRI